MAFNRHPIGVFDSGLGGLTVVRELMRQLPCEDIVYYGDTARVPYGTKSKEAIISFSKDNTRVLLKYKVKMVIVACNSSSSYALESLRNEFPVPVVGVIHPGAKKAVSLTKNNRVGVAATSATIASGEYEKTVRFYGRKVKVFVRACPLLVPLVEEGWFDKPVTLTVAREYMAPLKEAGIDALILGCTHYPLLKDVLQKAVGRKVVLVDSAQEVSSEVKQFLLETGNNNDPKRKARYQFLVSDRPQGFQKIARRFLGKDISVKNEK
jgi:glutamate racemase